MLCCSFLVCSTFQIDFTTIDIFLPVTIPKQELQVHDSLAIKLAIPATILKVKYKVFTKDEETTSFLLKMLNAQPPFVSLKVFGASAPTCEGMKKGTSTFKWAVLEVPNADVTDLELTSISTCSADPPFKHKAKMLTYIARNWDHCKLYMDAVIFTTKVKDYIKQETGQDVQWSGPVSNKSTTDL